MKVVLRSTTAVSGALSAMTTGTSEMERSYVGSSVTVAQQRCGLVLILDAAQDRFGWTTFAVLAMRLCCQSAASLAGVHTTAAIMKMQG